MAEFFTWIMNFVREFKLLTIIMPWERAARIRLGSRVAVWEPGWHIRLPFIDEVIPLNTRLRIADTGSQTLTTPDGHTLTVGISVGFRIQDPLAAMLKMQHPENACSAIAASVVAALVSITPRGSLLVGTIEEHVRAELVKETTYEFDFIRVRDFAYARAFRLLNENCYRSASVTIEERKL
jgi:regulator of protease activity HflC (stomatin/prohibitin superfamily)